MSQVTPSEIIDYEMFFMYIPMNDLQAMEVKYGIELRKVPRTFRQGMIDYYCQNGFLTAEQILALARFKNIGLT